MTEIENDTGGLAGGVLTREFRHAKNSVSLEVGHPSLFLKYIKSYNGPNAAHGPVVVHICLIGSHRCPPVCLSVNPVSFSENLYSRRPIQYYTLTKRKREVAVSIVVFRPARETFGNTLPPQSAHSPALALIRQKGVTGAIYSQPQNRTDNFFGVASLMGGGDNLNTFW
ncbi:hypothetical protein EVAR_16792_1 [Eumeta japonica]|uniref:Uncharacterized protein n=1 Tax=Eumeta variegata TaxID=151549 RepID=A0A4C1UKY9_EUMVA|nr:hypothetical protein EVAR_16792_1 [Eumeta japonica]